jgi:hypothetical protein
MHHCYIRCEITFCKSCKSNCAIFCFQESLKRILTIFAKLNPGIRYVQGMNEVLRPLFYVFKNDPNQSNVVSILCRYFLTHIKGECIHVFSVSAANIDAICDVPNIECDEYTLVFSQPQINASGSIPPSETCSTTTWGSSQHCII